MYRSILVILLAGQLSLLAADPRAGENSGVDASQKARLSAPSEQLNFQTDRFTGRFGYSVPMPLAPGRHDSAPEVALHYNSANGNGICGTGWDLDFGFIQRETRYGVPVQWNHGKPVKAYDDSKGFTFSLNGKGASLVNVGGSEFRAEIEGGFLRFQLLTNLNQWQVTDLSGNKYFFGTNSASRMSNTKSGWPSTAWNGTYRWALTHVETVLGDTIDYTYTTVGGMLYPLKISYNGHVNGVANTHTVDFQLATRSDVTVSYTSGYRVEQSRRIRTIAHKVSGQMVWSNRLNYAQSPSTSRSLLQSISRYGTNRSSTLPPITFDYNEQQFGFQPEVHWTNMYIPPPTGEEPYIQNYTYIAPVNDGYHFADVIDMDGDGLPDRVFQTNTVTLNSWYVQHNNGSGFDQPKRFGPLTIQTYSDSLIQSFSSASRADWMDLDAYYTRMLDVNGDGLPDRVCDPAESLSGATDYRYNHLMVQFNQGTNFAADDTPITNVIARILLHNDPFESRYQAIEKAGELMMLDMNGDGRPDRVMARLTGGPTYTYTNYFVQFNTGTGFTTTNTFGFVNYGMSSSPDVYGGTLNSTFVRLLDMNGDGLPDRVLYPINNTTHGPEPNCANFTFYEVEFNNGYGFESPVAFGGVVGQYTAPQTGTCAAQLRCTGDSVQDSEDCILRDFNGDGLPDRIYRYYQCAWTNLMVQINLGTNFAAPQKLGPYYSQRPYPDENLYSALQSPYSRFMDINGDGLPDHVMAASPISTTNYLAVELSKGPFPDLLSSISNGIGGGMSVTYRPSTQFDNRDSTNALARNLMPFPMQLVASVAVSDGIHSANTTEYSYEGGKWDSERREFDGFAKTVEIDPLGLTSVLWFHQSGGRDHSALGEYSDTADAIAKKGSVFRSELIGTNGQLYKLVLNKIEDADLGDGRHFAFASQTLALDYPGSTNAYRATAKQFFYDLNTGNLTNSIDFGEVTNVDAAAHSFSDVVGDKLYQFTTFATLANADILDKPERSLLTSDSAGQDVLRESLFDYDGNTGNLTQQRDRMCPTCYVTNSFGYDSYNNQTAATNEAGIVTTAVYDSTYQTFPVQQTVGGTFTSGFKYDARSGKLLLSTNAAGLVTATTYDGFFRPLEVSVSTTPNAKPSLWLARYTYQLGMRNGFSTNSVRLRKNDGVDTTNGHETWTYTDGLGRLIQLRDEAETGSYRVTDTAHDERGNIEFQSLPYFDAGTKFGKATTCLGASTEFDPIGRPNKITSAVTGHFTSGRLTSITATGGDSGSPVGPSLIDYNDGNDPWTLVFTDGESKVHKYSLDAFGRTNQIVEVTGGGNFTTSLKYNLAGDLTNIVDHAGNQIEYAYNDLGQMIAMADPDLGVWQYRRDFAGRLREQVDANGQLVRFNYDDPLGRLRSKQVYDYTGAFAYGVTNVYDTSDDANFTVYPGQLYQVIDQEGWQKSGYDVRGRTVRTARYVAKNSATYTNQFGYDAADRLVLNVYPNGGPTITNIFDKGGNLSRVKQVGGAGTTFYTAQGFNNLGQLTGITFGNGVETTYDYYSNSKRLQQTLTAKGTAKLQNLSYTYDKVSNLKSITDGVYTNNDSASLSSLVYDDLHRLTSLTRPAISQTTTFAYDTIGNLTANSENGGGAYNYGTRLPHAVKSANGKNYAYDANGNMLVRGTQRLAYDAENRLVYVVTTNTYSMFGYDAGGSRLWKQSSGTNGLQIWIGGNYEEKNGQILFHITANGQTVCTFDKTGTNVFVYYHADHLHSTSIETDASGARTQHYEYMVFGQDRFTESASAFPVSRRYTSQVLDEDTGLYYYGARYYDPVLGRFIQPDTIIPNLGDPQSLNRYAYARNNPLKHNDPTGHSEDNVVKRVTAPPGVFYAPIHIDAPNVSFSINPNVNIANFPTPIAGPETATIGAPPSHLGDEILRGGGMSQFIGTPIGEHIAGMNAEAILTAPGMEISFAKIGRIIGGTTSSRSMLEGGAYQDLSTAGQVRHHIPAKSVSPLSVGEGPAIRMDPADHMKTASWGRSKAAQGYRAAQETLINQGKFSEAQKMDIQDIISKFGNKYNRGIGQAQKYTETLPPQKLLPLQQSMKK